MKSWWSLAVLAIAAMVVAALLIDVTSEDGPEAAAGAEEAVVGAGDVEGTTETTGSDEDVTTTFDEAFDGTVGTGVDGNEPSILAELGGDDYYTDFSQPLGDEWLIYNSIGHAGWGLRRPSAVGIISDPAAAGGHVLTITASMGTGDEAGLLVSGGMKLLRPQIYGRYTMRVKVDKDPAEVTSGVGLLWPVSNRWPQDGEIDIFETWGNRATRTPVESNLHWLNPEAEPPYERADDVKALHLHEGVDGSEWHVYQLEWRADLVSISIDGNEPAVLSTNPDEIADWNMEPTLQLDAFPSPLDPARQPEVETDVVMYVDYIAVEG